MLITGFAPEGFDGNIVHVEVDLRRSIPGIDIVGLPDGAVREARERVRVAIKNSGFTFPKERILVNLAPAGVKKEGASFDLALALAILHASAQIPPVEETENTPVMVLGELQLSGRVRPVHGVLSAIATGIERGVTLFLVPWENLLEARSLKRGTVYGVGTLTESVKIVLQLVYGRKPKQSLQRTTQANKNNQPACDLSEMKGQFTVKRALEIAAAGRHHLFLFGPPGSGKTMAASRLPSIMPDLTNEESITVTKIYSLAGQLPENGGLVRRPPFRAPHHSATAEGIIGGGKPLLPGEVSLAHCGILFIDEAPEYNKAILQNLREPVERGRVDIVRAGAHYWFPSKFQLILAANPCACGNLGRDEAVCVCSLSEIRRYWRQLGGALLDRIDIRVPVTPSKPEEMLYGESESSQTVRERVYQAIDIQQRRFSSSAFRRNGEMPPSVISYYCRLTDEAVSLFTIAVKKLSLSSRAHHSILKVARTIADMDGASRIEKKHLLEAVEHRRYGDNDYFWER